jgi:Ca2+-binding EF-hand superfamily protein
MEEETMKMNAVIGSAALALLAAGAVNAQGVDAASKSNTSFASVDTNKDGNISKDEVRYMEDLNGAFSKLDTNSDGMLSQAEFGKHSASGASSSSSSSTPSTTPSTTPGAASSSSVPDSSRAPAGSTTK